MAKGFTRDFKISDNVFKILSKGKNDPISILKEYFDNERDAAKYTGGRHVIVAILYKGKTEQDNRFVIIGNSAGITPYVHAEDGDKLANFWNGVEKKRLIEGRDDILDYVPLRALMNYQTMSESVAKSWKAYTKDTFGKMGYGGTSGWQGMGDRGAEGMFVVSRPWPSVIIKGQSQPYGSSYAENGTIFPWVLTTPSREDWTKSEQKHYTVAPSNQEIIGKWPKVVKSAAPMLTSGVFSYGTRVEVYGIPEEFFDGIKIEKLLKALQRAYGHLIHYGKMEIVFVDAYTHSGQINSGVPYTVSGLSYHGTPLIQEKKLLTPKHKAELEVDIRLDRDKNHPGIDVYVGDYFVNPMHLLAIQELGPIWREDRLTGMIQIPESLGIQILTAEKASFRGSYGADVVNAMRRLEPRLQDSFTEKDTRINTKKLDQVTKIVQQVLPDSLSEDPFLGSLLGKSLIPEVQPKEKSQSRTESTGSGVNKDSFLIRIENQYKEGVPNIPVRLMKVNQDMAVTYRELEVQQSNENGSVEFKKVLQRFRDGLYRVQIRVDKNVRIGGGSDYVDSYLDNSKRGDTFTFRLAIPGAEPKFPVPSAASISVEPPAIDFEPLPDVTVGWRPDQYGNSFTVNTAHKSFAEADARGDMGELANIIGEYTASYIVSSIMTKFLPNEKDPLVLAQRSSTFSIVYKRNIMEALLAVDKKEAKARK